MGGLRAWGCCWPPAWLGRCPHCRVATHGTDWPRSSEPTERLLQHRPFAPFVHARGCNNQLSFGLQPHSGRRSTHKPKSKAASSTRYRCMACMDRVPHPTTWHSVHAARSQCTDTAFFYLPLQRHLEKSWQHRNLKVVDVWPRVNHGLLDFSA